MAHSHTPAEWTHVSSAWSSVIFPFRRLTTELTGLQNLSNRWSRDRDSPEAYFPVPGKSDTLLNDQRQSFLFSERRQDVDAVQRRFRRHRHEGPQARVQRRLGARQKPRQIWFRARHVARKCQFSSVFDKVETSLEKNKHFFASVQKLDLWLHERCLDTADSINRK